MFGRTRVIGLLLTVLFLGLSLWQVDVNEMGRALSAADYRWVVPAVAVTLLGYVFRTVRWRYLLLPTRDVDVHRLFPILIIGFMANNVLPARMGEFVRAFALGRQVGTSKSFGLATIMLERVFDGLTLVALLAALSLAFPLPGWGTEAAVVGTVLFAGAVIGAVLLLTQETLVLRLLRAVLAWAPEHIADFAEERAKRFTLGLEVLRRASIITRIVTLSLGVWLLEAASYYFLITGFRLPLQGATPIYAALFTLVMVNLGIMIPSAPGYVGTFQFFAVLALGVFGVGREPALGVAIVSHAMQYALITGLGLFFLARTDLSLNVLRGARSESEVSQT